SSLGGTVAGGSRSIMVHLAVAPDKERKKDEESKSARRNLTVQLSCLGTLLRADCNCGLVILSAASSWSRHRFRSWMPRFSNCCTVFNKYSAPEPQCPTARARTSAVSSGDKSPL